VKSTVKVLYSPAKIGARVAQLGRTISRDYSGRTLDVVAILENSMLFAADLIRHITCPMVCHFVRAEIRDVIVGGYERKEIFFSPEPVLRDRHVLLVDAVLQSGVTLDFWAKRLMETRPSSLRMAVLVDKPQERKVPLKPDYFCFETASKYLVGYGLPGPHGLHRNLPYVGTLDGAPRQMAGGRKRKKKSRGK
jgi:hypoxanthine phosphoribosyltransferase